MSSTRTVALVPIALIASLLVPGESRGEDGVLWNGFRAIQAGELASTRPSSFMSAVPGGRFVVTVAHVAASPEDALTRGVPATCESVRFRVDTLTLRRADGTIEVELGEEQSLAPGRAVQVVHDVDRGSGAGMPAWDADLMGFRLRAEKASSRCGIVGSGLFYADASTTSPTPIALIPNVGAASGAGPDGGR